MCILYLAATFEVQNTLIIYFKCKYKIGLDVFETETQNTLNLYCLKYAFQKCI